MASPQKEKGYTAIANEIMEVMAGTPGFTSSMHRLTMAIFRKTYGWKKKADRISISQLVEMTELSKRTVIYALQQLEYRKIIIVVRRKQKGTEYPDTNEISFNKNYETWEVEKCAPQVERNRKINLKNYKEIVQKSKKMDTKDSAKVSKKIVQKSVKDSAKSLHIQKKHKRKNKSNSKKYKYFLEAKQVAELINAFKPINPMYQDFFERNPERQAVDLIAKRIGYEKTLSVIQQLPKLTGLPYAPKISSPLQLRKELGKLIIFYNQEMSKRSSHKKEDREIIL